MIRVVLPQHLQVLANVNREIELQVEGPETLEAVLEALEDCYPMLRGTMRDQVTLERRPFIRFFACGEDLSQDSPAKPLPEQVLTGKEPLRVVGAMAGGKSGAGDLSAPALGIQNPINNYINFFTRTATQSTIARIKRQILMGEPPSGLLDA